MRAYNKSTILARFALLCCSAALVVSFASQYGFNIQPCSLCVYQRYILGALCLFLALHNHPLIKQFSKFSIMGVIVCGLSLSIYHYGIEQKMWAGPSYCTATQPKISRSLPIEEQVRLFTEHMAQQKNIVRCDVVGWTFLGQSITVWLAIFYSLLMILAIML